MHDHALQQHQTPHPFGCKECGRTFSDQRGLDRHQAGRHQNAPVCLECGQETKLVGGREIYPHRADLYKLNFYRCACGAYCGCHKGTTSPLGKPCGQETRKARSEAHVAFDPLWKTGRMERKQAYAWLSEVTGIPSERCHIGMMDADEARDVVAAVQQFTKEERVQA
ncbi:hypothetical protein GRI39_02160 [Altererythrobacter indicus]|uniref:C2H2-type domain-containing protein n=2 Tax=Altericroceibacterium indicum TaxID=374177 RepID=A0A845A729_9SPHN|nr:hypothetical protein [Altericroceibacterium indicum]